MVWRDRPPKAPAPRPAAQPPRPLVITAALPPQVAPGPPPAPTNLPPQREKHRGGGGGEGAARGEGQAGGGGVPPCEGGAGGGCGRGGAGRPTSSALPLTPAARRRVVRAQQRLWQQRFGLVGVWVLPLSREEDLWGTKGPTLAHLFWVVVDWCGGGREGAGERAERERERESPSKRSIGGGGRAQQNGLWLGFGDARFGTDRCRACVRQQSCARTSDA